MPKSLLILVSFLFFSTSYSQEGFQIKRNKSKVVIPFKLINNLIFIPIELNGEELTFLLDTGVDQTILFSLNEDNEVELNNVEVIKLKGLGNSNAINGYKSSNNTVTIKQLVDKNHTIYIVLDQEFNFSSHVGIPVNGILGYHFFKNNVIEIDYHKKKIYVYNDNYKKRERLIKGLTKDSISIELNKPYILKSITSKGVTKKSKLLIDSGNSDAVWIFNHEKVKLPLPDLYLEDFLGRGFNGNVYGKRSRIDNIEFGGHIFKNALTNFTDSTSTQSVTFVDHRVGSIGGEILSRFKLILDYKNKLIYTEPNSTINDPFNFNMSGIEVEHAGLQWVKEERRADSGGIKILTDTNSGSNLYGTGNIESSNNLKTQFNLIPVFKIFSVRPNSEAEKTGLKKGDRIISINRTDASKFTIQKIHELLKSEEEKIIRMIVERNGVEIKVEFLLKKIL